MNITDMEAAVRSAKAELERADVVATDLANLLEGRLRRVRSNWVLKRLKRELRDYNIHTGQWKPL